VLSYEVLFPLSSERPVLKREAIFAPKLCCLSDYKASQKITVSVFNENVTEQINETHPVQNAP
jgi:hypothetical protein